MRPHTLPTLFFSSSSTGKKRGSSSSGGGCSSLCSVPPTAQNKRYIHLLQAPSHWKLPAGAPGYFSSPSNFSGSRTQCHSCHGEKAGAAPAPAARQCGEHALFFAHGVCCSSQRSVRSLSGGTALFTSFKPLFFVIPEQGGGVRDLSQPGVYSVMFVIIWFFFPFSFFHSNTSRPTFTCGGNITGESGVIGSQGYPGVYPPNTKCVWRITVSSLSYCASSSIAWSEEDDTVADG